MDDKQKSPLDIAMDACEQAMIEALEHQHGGDLTAAELRALDIRLSSSGKPERRRPDFHGLTVIDGGKK